MRVLGFMSGTSLDGVDAAILETDGVRVLGFGPALLHPYAPEDRDYLHALTEAIVAADLRGDPLPDLAKGSEIVLQSHLAAGRAVLADPEAGAVELAGFHGQTVLHRPARRYSLQLGDSGALARGLGTPVVADFRQSDMAAGGEGAPIAPIYHSALADKVGQERPLAFLNIGGIANVTWIGARGEIVAFDTGPGNGLIDLTVQARGLGRYDDGGRLGLAGTVDESVLAQLLASAYFDIDGPKSLDRYDFPLESVATLNDSDAVATLTAFTAAAVALAVRRLPRPPRCWVVCGGGRHNPALLAELRARAGHFIPAEDLGLRGDFIEAEMMAFLAARSVRGLPITFPTTTGVPGPTTGGTLYPVTEAALS